MADPNRGEIWSADLGIGRGHEQTGLLHRALKAHGIYMEDVSPGNIAFAD